MLPALTLAVAGADGCIRHSRHKVSEKGILVRVAAILVRTGSKRRSSGVQGVAGVQERREWWSSGITENSYPRPYKLNLGYDLFNTPQLHWLKTGYSDPWPRLLNPCNS
jgi:hypothetical protein